MFSISPLKKFLVYSILLIFCGNANAQAVHQFFFMYPLQKVSNSLYNKVSLIDLRHDTTSLGKMEKGVSGNNTVVTTPLPISVQLRNILTASTDKTSKAGELLLQLRHFSFSELPVGDEKAYFHIQALLYAKQSDGYHKLDGIDSIMVVKNKNAATSILDTSGNTLINFIVSNLKKEPANTKPVTYNDVLKADSAEKAQLKLYSNTTLNDGVYFSYEEFRDQTPSATIVVDGGEVKKNTVKFINGLGQAKKINPETTYAFVYKGVPYIVNPYDFYVLNKVNNDFVFTGKILLKPRSAALDAVGYQFGLVGGLIMAGVNTEKTIIAEIKINHLNGEFIRIKEVSEVPAK